MKSFVDEILKLSQVPSCTEEGARMHENFLTNYGTHYIKSATFGGLMHLSVLVNYTYYSNMTTKTKFETTLLKHLDNLFNGTQHVLDQQYMAHIKVNTSLYGGDTSLGGNVTAWKASIPVKRVPVAWTLKPISDLNGGDNVKNAHFTAMFKYELQQWRETMLYIKNNIRISASLPENHGPSAIVRAIERDFLNKTCPIKDKKWSFLYGLLTYDTRVGIRMRDGPF